MDGLSDTVSRVEFSMDWFIVMPITFRHDAVRATLFEISHDEN